MKTAISIPDDVYEQAEYIARKHGMNRSQFYVLAIQDFIRSTKGRSVTTCLNEVYADQGVADAGFERAALADMPEEDWS